MVLKGNDILAVDDDHLEIAAHEGGEACHTLRVDLLPELGQSLERDDSVAQEHDCDDYDRLYNKSCAPLAVVSEDLPVRAHCSRLDRLTCEVNRSHDPEVQSNVPMVRLRVPLPHSVVHAEQEAMEDHEADVHHEDGQVLEDLELTDEFL